MVVICLKLKAQNHRKVSSSLWHFPVMFHVFQIRCQSGFSLVKYDTHHTFCSHYLDTNRYSLSAQKWTSVSCVKGSTHKMFIGLQYELITIAPNHYPRPIKSVVYASNCELTNKILLRWTHVWYSWLIGHN